MAIHKGCVAISAAKQPWEWMIGNFLWK